MCPICCIWFPSRDESSMGLKSCCLVTGGVQTFIALLLFPTWASVSHWWRSSCHGDVAQAHRKMAWKALFDGINWGSSWVGGIRKHKQPWWVQMQEQNMTLEQIWILLELQWWPTSVLQSSAYFRTVSSGHVRVHSCLSFSEASKRKSLAHT